MNDAADIVARRWQWLLVVLVLAIYAVRLAAPLDFEADAQDRNIGYVMDAVWQGHWLAQTDIRDRVMSKPPLHTWLAGAFAVAGGINRLTLTLPSALSVLALALLVFQVGRRRFGTMAAGFAGLAVALAPMMARHVVLIRTDALFTLTIALAAFAAFRAWERGQGWQTFWLASAAATLTKGPLGLLLAASGLLAWFWEKRTDPAAPSPRGSQRAGIALFLLLTLGWVLLAANAMGYKLIDRLFFAELFGQMTGMRKDITPGENFYKPAMFFMLRFLPFSLFAAYGLWRVAARPAASLAERRFERFLFVWIVFGLAVFAFAAHFRADLLLPLWPAAALLAGREMARLGAAVGMRRMAVGAALLGVALFAATVWNSLFKAERINEEVRYTLEAVAAADALRASGLDLNRLQHLDTAVTLQLKLGTFSVWIDEAEALQRLRDGEILWLAVESPRDFGQLFGPEAPPLRKVFDAHGVSVHTNVSAQ